MYMISVCPHMTRSPISHPIASGQHRGQMLVTVSALIQYCVHITNNKYRSSPSIINRILVYDCSISCIHVPNRFFTNFFLNTSVYQLNCNNFLDTNSPVSLLFLHLSIIYRPSPAHSMSISISLQRLSYHLYCPNKHVSHLLLFAFGIRVCRLY